MHIFNTTGEHEINFDLDHETIRMLRINWQHFSKNVNSYPDLFEGKGIVICGGGIKFFTCAWVAIRRLRTLGCTLPIELWTGKNEYIPDCPIFMVANNVTWVKSTDFNGGAEMEGWMLKPFAILNSKFKEVISIDADNICVKNPEFLFELPEYKMTGALFWKDYWYTARDNPIWEIMNVPYSLTNEVESGQMVLNKEMTWQPMNLCLYLNKYKEIYYSLLFGDKDTFRFSWLALGYDFHLINQEPSCLGFNENGTFKGITMIQYDTCGYPLFLHRNLIKWDRTDTNKFLWQNFKKFNSLRFPKEYISSYCNTNKHYFIDFGGLYETYDFVVHFGDIEAHCYDLLEELRTESFYKDFIINQNIKNRI
ncbi:hypothetical protein GCM10027566_21870 [Arachidicoccus ginsenosidivorans]|uniref:Uncharacterized protein n=1 Tax=Arachidicoccus ginsenosidivorans TaxID=496057 RepID=A0A5B8VLG7_9BACT|nr:hypothetical protein [Arachidicoccus ginsenosidivorans]QEC72179.1 hypothetical protein FSB73_11350 [Arachidicoccus ginsenosidivorans]